MALSYAQDVLSAEPDISSLLARASATQDWLRGKAAEIEQRRCLTAEVAERLVADGFFRITQPHLYGGLGLNPKAAWEVVLEVARGCSSTAWILGLSSANVVMIGKFSAEAQSDVFLSGKPTIVSLLTGGVGRDIRVEHADGGMRLSGRWHYASGIDVATWAGLLVPIPQTDGQPVMHVVLVPADAFSVDHESWNVLGMRGTGSKNIALDSVFVPAHRWMNWQLLQEGGCHPSCPKHGAISDAPLNAINAMSTLAPMLGVASAVAEEFRAIVRAKVSPAAQQALIDDKGAQIEAATGEATLAILRRSLLDDADDIVRMSAQDGVDLMQRAAMRTRIAVASRLALRTAQDMFAALGGSVLPAGTRIERLFRDVHAMSSHMLLQPGPIGEAYGRLLLGLPLPPTARL